MVVTGHWPPADLPGLHIDLGHWPKGSGTWLRLPTADYRCACGFTASASGDGVPHFTATVHSDHQPHCPLPRKASA